MSFNLETTDMDLGDTPIENIFINDYMPMANGTYVKVYLLGYKYAHDRDGKIEVNNRTISKHLQIPLEDVLSAWDFWEKKGIIRKISKDLDPYDYGVEFLNLKQLYIKNNLGLIVKEAEIPSSPEPSDLVEANQNPEYNRMFYQLSQTMRRPLSTNEKLSVLRWIMDYGLAPEVIERAFSYGVDQKGIKNIKYINGILKNWYDLGATNLEDLDRVLKAQDERYYIYREVLKSIGAINRSVTPVESKIIDKWLDEYAYNKDLIARACQEAGAKTSNLSVGYIDGIVSSWYEKGIRSLSEVDLKDQKPRETKSPARPSPKKTRFHNFEQRTDKYSSKDLEEIVRRKRQDHQNKIKGEA